MKKQRTGIAWGLSGRHGFRYLAMLAACAAGGLLFLSCSMVEEAQPAPSASLVYANGVETRFAKAPAGASEIEAVATKPSSPDSPLVYNMTALTSSDLPARAVSVTLTPAQTLGNGTTIKATARIRLTILNSKVDAKYAPQSAVYDLDETTGFGMDDCFIPAGPGKLVVNWQVAGTQPLWPNKDLTEFGLERDTITRFSFVAQKY